MSPLLLPIVVPLVFAALLRLLPSSLRRIAGIVTMAGALASAVAAILASTAGSADWVLAGRSLLRLDTLGRMALVTGMVMALPVLWTALAEPVGTRQRLWAMMAALSAASLCLMADHLILLVVGWGCLGWLLYLLIPQHDAPSAEAAKKTLALIGGTDALLLLGVGYWIVQAGTPALQTLDIRLDGPWPWIALVAVLSAVLAKTGAMPFHTWLPDMAQQSPASVNALIPATLDKLVGVYFLARIVQAASPMPHTLRVLLMALGVLSLLGGVMMALVQHDMRRLLAYHAVSQVGYMILGLGAGTALGLAGAFFHLINNVLYKSGLFLSAGAVRRAVGHTDLDRLGGLSAKLPMTFGAFMVMALAISGVPPLNGFVSKWLIAQGLIQGLRQGEVLAPLALVAALVGSGLTLASFLKVAYAVFLGPTDPTLAKADIAACGRSTWVPLALISAACVALGLGGMAWITPRLLPDGGLAETLWGNWSPATAGLLLGLGLAVGFLILAWMKALRPRPVPRFGGGEALHAEERVLGTAFYGEVEALPGIRGLYTAAQRKRFDLYERGRVWLSRVAAPLRTWHSGLLNRYASWLIVGWAVLVALLVGVIR